LLWLLRVVQKLEWVVVVEEVEESAVKVEEASVGAGLERTRTGSAVR